MSEEVKAPQPAANPTEAPVQPQQRQQITLDMADMSSAYANWYRVTGTPEELILEFALNPEHVMAPTQPIKVTNRLILSFYTAKRLMTALQFAVNRHESMFGPVEIDPQRRLRQMPPQQPRQ
ncbi:MAG TPA: DUF3467 domain-containing protein [Gemmataceae bacterium]|jgi:hypothetical protein|nr:DUF3467 domain-containing protein [Gemmataceae bacterium]